MQTAQPACIDLSDPDGRHGNARFLVESSPHSGMNLATAYNKVVMPTRDPMRGNDWWAHMRVIRQKEQS